MKNNQYMVNNTKQLQESTLIKKTMTTQSRNVNSKKGSSHTHQATQMQQSQQQCTTTRFGIQRPQFEVANIGLRKSSMQQPTVTQSQQILQQQMIHKTQSQNRMTPIQRIIPISNLLLQSIDSNHTNKENPSRNVGIQKSSSQQNPSQIKKGSHIQSQFTTATNFSYNNCGNSSQSPQTQRHGAKLKNSTESIGFKFSITQTQSINGLNSPQAQCETGASIDIQSVLSQRYLKQQHTQEKYSDISGFAKINEITSLRSSMNSDNGNLASASLLEGAVGVMLPTSKINTAAMRHQGTKQMSKYIGDEGENILFSDEEQNESTQNQENRDTILDCEHTQSLSDEFSKTLHESQLSSFANDGGEGILPLLESFCKKSDIKSLTQFKNLIKGQVQKSLLYRAIEYRQVVVLKYLLTKCAKVTNNSNLLHIACRSKDSSLNSKGNDSSDLEIVKTVLLYDKFSNLDGQDTYGNTPVHLAAQNGKADVLSFFLSNYNPQIYLKNSEGSSALHSSSTQEIFKIFVNYIQKLKDTLSKEGEQQSSDAIGSLSSRSYKHRKGVVRNKSEHQLNMPNINNNIAHLHHKKSKRAPLKEISMNVNSANNNQNSNNHHSNASKMASSLSKESNAIKKNIEQRTTNISSYYCETEPVYTEKKNKKLIPTTTTTSDFIKNQFFKDEDFEKIVEYTESDEDGCNDDFDDNKPSLQFCEDIEEVSDESLQQSIILLQVQQKIGPHSFEPISLLGSGSFGEVYLVKMKENQKLYAMKVLQKQRIMAQNLVKYAVTERNVLSYTKHPFIVGLNYAFQTHDKLVLILDYCPGGDLGKVLTREKRLCEDRARIYLAEVLLALEDLHKRDIIFRDLKPDNVVIDENGHALLTDFGLSKEGVLDNQAAKSFCGSVAYLAPEMLKRTGHGKSVDWYLLGVLLYEMLVGIPPYFDNNRDQLFNNIQRGPLLIPSSLSQEAKTLLIGLLSNNPLKRLGAGLRDAEEIKEHDFFKDLNWDEVAKRSMKPPKPEFREIMPMEIPYTQIFNEQRHGGIGGSQDDENKLQGWSFVTPSSNPQLQKTQVSKMGVNYGQKLKKLY